MQMIDGSAFSYLLFVLTLWRGSFYYDCGSRKLNNTIQALLSTLVKLNPKAWQKKLCATDWKPTGTSYNFCSPFPWFAGMVAMALWKQYFNVNFLQFWV